MTPTGSFNVQQGRLLVVFISTQYLNTIRQKIYMQFICPAPVARMFPHDPGTHHWCLVRHAHILLDVLNFDQFCVTEQYTQPKFL